MRAIDLFCGLGGWTDGLLAAGYDVTGYDIEAHEYDGECYPAKLVLADVMELDGAQFADADLIVASPPCQEFSYMAMPWKRAKQIARALRGQDDFPDGYKGSRTIEELTALFDASFRIQREASAAAGRHIPLIVENVRGAQPWVGRAQWNYGSYYLWGDVPALMPQTLLAVKVASDTGRRTDLGNGARFTSRDCGIEGRKNPGFRFDGVKQSGLSGVRDNGKGDRWFQDGAARSGSKSSARKAASARIAKIPFALSHWIARTYQPETDTQNSAGSSSPNPSPADDTPAAPNGAAGVNLSNQQGELNNG